MKNLSFILLAVCIAIVSALGQAPQSFNYQAVVRDFSGEIIANQGVSLRISILQGSPAGASVYTETHNPITNEFGLVNLAIGQGNTVDDFSAIDWSMGPYYSMVELDPDGGSNYTVTGTSQLLSVPYALHAGDVEEKTFAIGDMVLGGLVFHVNADGTHGLVAAKVDQYTSVNWYDAQDALSDPARHDMDGAKFTDWRLPSKWELNMMYTNLYLAGMGNFADDGNERYWSSTLIDGGDPFDVWSQRFDTGTQGNDGPLDEYFVRAVREF